MTLQLLDLTARLNREIGPQSDHAPEIRITMATNVRLDTLGPEPPALPLHPTEEP